MAFRAKIGEYECLRNPHGDMGVEHEARRYVKISGPTLAIVQHAKSAVHARIERLAEVEDHLEEVRCMICLTQGHYSFQCPEAPFNQV